jgi:hypothetical protein
MKNHSRTRYNRTLLYVLLVIIIICCILLLFNTRFKRVVFIAQFILKSRHYKSYYDWAKFCRKNLLVGKSLQVYTPNQPHFILLNHIKSHEYMGSFMSSALVVGNRPCKIVCYDNYRMFSPWPISNIMNSILQDEIRVCKNMCPLKKEKYLVDRIKQVFKNNYNIVMFIESHKGNEIIIRQFYKVILNYFPHIYKQYYHLHEPEHDHVRTFSYKAYMPTLLLDDILETRKIIVKEYHDII